MERVYIPKGLPNPNSQLAKPRDKSKRGSILDLERQTSWNSEQSGYYLDVY